MVLIIMGVSGSGKTTIGKLLSDKLGWRFYEGDEYHPKENIEKMKNGISLNDEDRKPWLMKLRSIIEESISKKNNIIISCSALKESYRKILQVNNEVNFVYLKGSFEMVEKRMKEREDHFMKPGMLQSQFDALDEPKNAIIVDIENSSEKITINILNKIKSQVL
ncbi:MAG: gluconokinase [Ignavibacteriaceae bacterium]